MNFRRRRSGHMSLIFVHHAREISIYHVYVRPWVKMTKFYFLTFFHTFFDLKFTRVPMVSCGAHKLVS